MNTKSEALGRAAHAQYLLIDPEAPRKRREVLVVNRIGLWGGVVVATTAADRGIAMTPRKPIVFFL